MGYKTISVIDGLVVSGQRVIIVGLTYVLKSTRSIPISYSFVTETIKTWLQLIHVET